MNKLLDETIAFQRGIFKGYLTIKSGNLHRPKPKKNGYIWWKKPQIFFCELQLAQTYDHWKFGKNLRYMVIFAVGTAGGVPKKWFFNFQNRPKYIYAMKEHEKTGLNPSFKFLSQYCLPRYGGRWLLSQYLDSFISRDILGTKCV